MPESSAAFRLCFESALSAIPPTAGRGGIFKLKFGF
jgi:hypothetical protein